MEVIKGLLRDIGICLWRSAHNKLEALALLKKPANIPVFARVLL